MSDLDTLILKIEGLTEKVEELDRTVSKDTQVKAYQEIGVREVARLKGVSEETVRQRCRRRELPFIPGSTPYRFIYHDIITNASVCSHRRLKAQLEAGR